MPYPPLHTAEHLLTALIHSHFPDLTWFVTRLKSRKAVVRFDCAGVVDEQRRRRLEEQLRALCAAGLPVTTYTVSRDVAEARLPNMHQLPAGEGPVRVVRIGREDQVADERACIGEHVSRTSEIRNPRLPTSREEEPGRWRVTLVVD